LVNDNCVASVEEDGRGKSGGSLLGHLFFPCVWKARVGFESNYTSCDAERKRGKPSFVIEMERMAVSVEGGWR